MVHPSSATQRASPGSSWQKPAISDAIDIHADGTFVGYASVFGVEDMGHDVVLAGAFAQSLAKRGVRGIKLLWQHEPGQPIGTWLTIKEDAHGLYVRGRLNLGVQRAQELLALMREGSIDGLSIGFRTERSMRDRKSGLRYLTKVDLWEISLVTFPMLPQARVTSVKRSTALPLSTSLVEKVQLLTSAFL